MEWFLSLFYTRDGLPWVVFKPVLYPGWDLLPTLVCLPPCLPAVHTRIYASLPVHSLPVPGRTTSPLHSSSGL